MNTRENVLARMIAGYPDDEELEACIKTALLDAIARSTFGVGDRVTCDCGRISGTIESIGPEGAVVLWSDGRRSTCAMQDMDQADH
jgi:hypothetical protein